MRIIVISFILVMICLCSSCIMVPKVDRSNEPKCKLVTKKLTVDTKKADFRKLSDWRGGGGGGGDARAAIVVLAGIGIVYSTSAIISGSIMVTGNTIHWIEQEGTCDDGVIKETIDNLHSSLQSAGVWIATSAEEIADWFKFKEEN